ncbi:sugar ABC transporter ATP-binding protein [Candidatus Aerophobetes bacterium]|nr:sugar ABC transporter ATP-binding protein [Candidatus Aerophobetes bacterium]
MEKQNSVVVMKNICKSFGGLQALKNVNLNLYEGEVLGIVGDNGAGKSTLIKILSGAYTKDEGEIYVFGEKRDIKSPLDARNLGIETIYQNLALVPEFTPVENVFLARELRKSLLRLRVLDRKKMKKEMAGTLKKIGIDSAMLGAVTRNLSGGQQQSVAISRAIHWDAKIIIMDEPTASLGVEESRRVFHVVRQLKEKGVSVILITHNMHSIFEVCDRIEVLRLGENAGMRMREKTTPQEVVGLIMGERP